MEYKYKENIGSKMREMGNMMKAQHKIAGKHFAEKAEKKEFFPKHPIARTISKHKEKNEARGKALDKKTKDQVDLDLHEEKRDRGQGRRANY